MEVKKMKKIIAILIALLMVCSLAACSNNDKEPTSSDNNDTQVSSDAGTSDAESVNTSDTADASPAQTLLADFKARVANGEDSSLEDLANSIITNEIIPFGGATMPVEPGFLNGFSQEITGFAEGTTFGPMIGSIPFIGYLFKLDDGADVYAFMQTLKDNADLRWNICVEADEMVCDAVGNTVFFVMAPANFEEN